MFSDKEVIEASRDFVCIRIDSYESEENQKIVRSYLQGRFENTAFCVLAPDGKQRLTRSGRGPHHVSRDFQDIAALSKRFRSKGKLTDSRVPDFNSFKLALNVASADQRVLVLVAGEEKAISAAEKRLRFLAWDEAQIGRFHYDFESDADTWKSAIKQDGKAGIYFIKPGEFGLEGELLEKAPLDADLDELAAAMKKANERYAEGTEKKVYSSHVAAGRKDGKKIEMAVEFGEDRDGDGEIDHRGGQGRGDGRRAGGPQSGRGPGAGRPRGERRGPSSGGRPPRRGAAESPGTPPGGKTTPKRTRPELEED